MIIICRNARRIAAHINQLTPHSGLTNKREKSANIFIYRAVKAASQCAIHK